MCKAKGDYLYIVTDVKGPNPILKVKCSPTEPTVDTIKTIQCRIDKFSFMYYLPDVCLAISFKSGDVVKPIHCDTDQEVWKVKGEVEGIKKPHNFYYLQNHKSLHMCDSDRLVILDPKNENVLRVLPVTNVGRLICMYLYDDNLNLIQ